MGKSSRDDEKGNYAGSDRKKFIIIKKCLSNAFSYIDHWVEEHGITKVRRKRYHKIPRNKPTHNEHGNIKTSPELRKIVRPFKKNCRKHIVGRTSKASCEQNAGNERP